MRAGSLRLLAIASTLLLGSATVTGRAHAHASPHVFDIVFRADGYVLLSNRGFIFGDAQRTQWRLMCTEVFGINTSERPALVAGPDGGLLVGTSRGLSSSSDQGCSWQGVAPFAATSVPALASDPSLASRVYLAAYTPEPSELGGLHRSDDGGVNWRKLRASDERDYIRSIAVAPSDSMRVYATGQSWDAAGAYTHYLLRSSDAGATWERALIELEDDEREVEVLAVSPNDPALIALRVSSDSPASNPERLLISRDAGATFVSPLELKLLSSVAFAADGSRAWAAGQDGLFESNDGARTFARVGPGESLSYVEERGGELFSGGFYAGIGSGANGVGVTRALGDGFSSFMELTDVKAPVACDPASQTASLCGRWWLDWERELMLGEFSPDAGPRAGSGGAGPAAGGGGSGGAAGDTPPHAGAPDAGVAKPPASSDGCTGAGQGGAAGANALWVASALGALALRRRRRAQAP